MMRFEERHEKTGFIRDYWVKLISRISYELYIVFRIVKNAMNVKLILWNVFCRMLIASCKLTIF